MSISDLAALLRHLGGEHDEVLRRLQTRPEWTSYPQAPVFANLGNSNANPVYYSDAPNIPYYPDIFRIDASRVMGNGLHPVTSIGEVEDIAGVTEDHARNHWDRYGRNLFTLYVPAGYRDQAAGICRDIGMVIPPTIVEWSLIDLPALGRTLRLG